MQSTEARPGSLAWDLSIAERLATIEGDQRWIKKLLYAVLALSAASVLGIRVMDPLTVFHFPI